MERCTQVSTTKQLVFLLVVTLAGVLVILCNNTNIASPRMSYSKLVVEDKANSTKLETVDKRLVRGERIVEMFPCPKTIGENFTCQYYRPAWQNRSDIKNVLEERMTRIRSLCNAYYPHMFNISLSRFGAKANSREKTRILKSSNLKLGFCFMPKMGSTFWKRAWVPVTKSKTKFGRLLPILRKSAKPSAYTRYNGYTMYTISRNPWLRMVSVYREKCSIFRKGRCKLNFGKRKCGKSFADFVKCFIKMSSAEKTERYGHLDVTYRKCLLCDYPYRYVVSMENMEKEMEYILTGAGVVNPISIMNKIRNATIRKVEKKNQNISYVDYWKRVPAKLIDKVRFYYRFEIFLFQYPETPFYIDNL